MNIRTLASLALVTLTAFTNGCAAGAASEKTPTVALTGKVGSGTTSTKSFGALSSTEGVKVVARRLHKRGEAGAKVQGFVGPDGKFELALPRGGRYVVTFDDPSNTSAMLETGDGKNVLAVSSGPDGASVDLGAVKVGAGEAYSDAKIDGLAGLQAALAEADEVFEAANGALVEAQQAVAEAEKAVAEAEAMAEKALGDAQAAAAAAEEAAKKAGAAP